MWCDVLGVLVQWLYGGVMALVCWFVVERFVMMWRYWFDEFVGLWWCGVWMCLCVGLWWCGGVGLLVCGGAGWKEHPTRRPLGRVGGLVD